MREKGRPLKELPVWADLVGGDSGAWYQSLTKRKAPESPFAPDYVKSAYLAEVSFMDAQLGILFDALKKHRIYERALIVLVSNHGELLGENGYYSHSHRLDPELIAAPLIIKWPHQKSALRVDSLVSIVDLFPTILASAGLPVPANDGYTLDSRNDEFDSRVRIYMEEHEGAAHGLWPYMKVADALYGIQELDYRQIVWDGGNRCYARRNSVWESASCAQSLTVALSRARGAVGGTNGKSSREPGVLGEEEEKALKALAYIR